MKYIFFFYFRWYAYPQTQMHSMGNGTSWSLNTKFKFQIPNWKWNYSIGYNRMIGISFNFNKYRWFYYYFHWTQQWMNGSFYLKKKVSLKNERFHCRTHPKNWINAKAFLLGLFSECVFDIQHLLIYFRWFRFEAKNQESEQNPNFFVSYFTFINFVLSKRREGDKNAATIHIWTGWLCVLGVSIKYKLPHSNC